ncbi:ProQ/FINO family protein [Enterobacter hormaechei]|uniref:ProQ/FINO family protein n=1 Tax=Enterobacter hormaechei TaxID=158836 RepID=UPI0030C805E5
MAQQRQDRRGQVQAATTAATSLAYDFFRFLKRPRVDLHGNPVSVVTPDEEKYAQLRLEKQRQQQARIQNEII